MTKINPADIEVIDEEGYSSSAEGGFKQIILDQVRRCANEGSKELTTAGVRTRLIQGRIIELYCPDQREIFRNAVWSLFCLLKPKIEANSQLMKEKIEQIKQRERDLELEVTRRRTEVRVRIKHPEKSREKSLLYNAENQRIDRFKDRVSYEIQQEQLCHLMTLLEKLNYLEEGSA
jgi:hypothetical protein